MRLCVNFAGLNIFAWFQIFTENKNTTRSRLKHNTPLPESHDFTRVNSCEEIKVGGGGVEENRKREKDTIFLSLFIFPGGVFKEGVEIRHSA